MMNKERAGINKFVPVELFPFVSSGPAAIAVFGKWKGRRRKTKNVQNQSFAVSGPAILDKSRLRFPTVSDCKTAILRPMPIGPGVKIVGDLSDFSFIFRVAIEIHCRRECSGY